jgi:glycine cleavage system H protein
MNIPNNVRYTKDHEWIRMEGEHAVIGITDFAQSELGDVVFIEIETLSESLGKGDVFGTIEAVKTVSDMFMPVAGEVVEVNAKLEQDPAVVNKDPFGDGWMIMVKVTDLSGLNDLLDAEGYRKLINAE